MNTFSDAFSPLREYRCGCGKLLFKGALGMCAVEVKCRRCGITKYFEAFDADGLLLVESDSEGRIAYVSSGAQPVVAELRDYALGRPLSDLYPLLRDGEAHQKALAGQSVKPYRITNNRLVLRDGVTFSVTSYIVPRAKDGESKGYRVFSWGTSESNPQSPT